MHACILVLSLLGISTCMKIYIGNKPYVARRICKKWGAEGRIIINKDVILYGAYSQHKLSILKNNSDDPQRVNTPKTNVYDLLMKPSGEVLVATAMGIYAYNFATNRAEDTGITRRSIFSISSMTNGSIYVADNTLSMLHKGSLRRVSDAQVYCVAFTREGHVYHTTDWDSPVFRSTATFSQREAISNIPAGYISLLEMDRQDDTLYVCHSEGLYFVAPKSSRAERVEGLNGRISGMAITPSREFFIGRHYELWKLIPQEKIVNK